jgi:predicted  nucleic acid-binding Zn-ribbon protein
MTFDKLDEKFQVVSTTLEEVETSTSPAIEDDAQHARETLRNLIDKGNEAIDGILHIAKNSDHPRAYEVAGQLIKTVSDTAKDLLEVQKRKKDLEKTDKPKIQTQNNLFVGSTHELLKAMKRANEPIEIKDVND